MSTDSINRKACSRSAIALCGMVVSLLLLLATAQPVMAQDSKPKPKRPTLRVRVVAADAGVPVVVEGAEAATAAGSDAVGEQDLQPTEPEVENWLVNSPPATETWLAPQVASPRPAPAPEGSETAAPASAELVGVQHYLDSVGASSTSEAGASATTRVTPPAATDTPVYASGPTAAAVLPDRTTAIAPAPRPSAPDDASLYRLGPGDQIDIHVWRNPELTRNVPVRPDGIISLPLAGELMASGKTVAELEREITAALGEYVQYPTVTVSVTEVRGLVVYVVGRVASPGTLQLDRPINVIQAIAMAGGLQEFADRNGVVVIRTVNGRETRLPFPYGDALKGKAEVTPIILQSGDVIYVP